MKIKEAMRQYIIDDASISAIVGTSIIPQLATMKGKVPYIIYQRSSADITRSLSGVSNLNNDVFNFIVYNTSQESVETLKNLLTARLDSMSRNVYSDIQSDLTLIVAQRNSEADDIDVRDVGDQEPIYSESLSYLIWYKET